MSTRSLGRQQTARDEAGEWCEPGAAGKDGACCELGVSSLTREAFVRLMRPRRRPQAHSQEWREVTGGKPGGVEWLVPEEDVGTGSGKRSMGRSPWLRPLGTGSHADGRLLEQLQGHGTSISVLRRSRSHSRFVARDRLVRRQRLRRPEICTR